MSLLSRFTVASAAAFALLALSGNAFADDQAKAAGLVAVVKNILSAAGLQIQTKPGAPAVGEAIAPRATPQSEQSSSSQDADQQVVGLIVRFRSSEAKRLSRANQPPPQELISEITQLAGVELTFVRAMSLDAFVFDFSTALPYSDAQAIAERIKASPSVEWVQLDLVMEHMLAPNDTYANSQWNLMNPAIYPGSAGLGPAWDVTRGSSSTVVAVVDTGIQPHPEFAARLLPGYDFVSNPLSANDGGGRDPDATDPGNWRTVNSG